MTNLLSIFSILGGVLGQAVAACQIDQMSARKWSFHSFMPFYSEIETFPYLCFWTKNPFFNWQQGQAGPFISTIEKIISLDLKWLLLHSLRSKLIKVNRKPCIRIVILSRPKAFLTYLHNITLFFNYQQKSTGSNI